MTASAPSDDDVRAKAYELWVARGRAHGRALDDWTRAKDILSQHSQASKAADPSALSAAQSMVDGVFGAAQLALSAMASAITGMVGSASAGAKAPPEEKRSMATDAADAALETAERKLRVEADKRIRDAKTEAAGTTASKADVAKAKVNPDG